MKIMDSDPEIITVPRAATPRDAPAVLVAKSAVGCLIILAVASVLIAWLVVLPVIGGLWLAGWLK